MANNIIYYRGYEITKNYNIPGYKVVKHTPRPDNKAPYEFFRFTATIETAIHLIDVTEDQKRG